MQAIVHKHISTTYSATYSTSSLAAGWQGMKGVGFRWGLWWRQGEKGVNTRRLFQQRRVHGDCEEWEACWIYYHLASSLTASVTGVWCVLTSSGSLKCLSSSGHVSTSVCRRLHRHRWWCHVCVVVRHTSVGRSVTYWARCYGCLSVYLFFYVSICLSTYYIHICLYVYLCRFTSNVSIILYKNTHLCSRYKFPLCLFVYTVI